MQVREATVLIIQRALSDNIYKGDRCMGNVLKRVCFIAGCLVILLIAGCGEKSPESVVKQLEKTLGNINGYKIEAEMTMHTGQEPRNYDIAIWYKKGTENFYRVVLENDEGEGGQVILRNEEGVFVLTPALKKSFKFQKIGRKIVVNHIYINR